MTHKYWDLTLPIRPTEIAKSMGIKVGRLSQLEYSCEADTRAGCKVVRVNHSENTNQQRFALAFGLGLHALDFLVLDEVIQVSRERFVDDCSESPWNAINTFALALLMPRLALDTLILREGETCIENLALTLRVSQAAVYCRLKQANIL